MRSVELFAGAGGLALGMARAGFRHELVIEFDRDTCTTIRENQRRGLRPIKDWRLLEADVRTVDYSEIEAGLDLLSGGPPCQPFSLGGKHRGYEDERDMFPEAVRGVRELRPRAFVFENVKGLMRESFASYFQYILLQLSYPEVLRKSQENWREHLSRLERHHTRGLEKGLSYRVVTRVLNTADYGVPQKRERVIIVGFRDDLGIEWSFPEVTHSLDSLLWSQWITGQYWDRHGIGPRRRPQPPAKFESKLSHMRSRLLAPSLEPWMTVRDATSDLPVLVENGTEEASNHRFVPGARAYTGHTGSHLDEPSKTLKAGDHGVPGGENTVVRPDGSLRYFTVREAARLQGFPDGYLFPVSWTESMRQLGNAVPVTLAEVIARSVLARLNLSAKSPELGMAAPYNPLAK
ncbi:MAG TPA: DNA cytosine methyltransferase [Blastocatellia bacterium]|nr:DNA cytosine methyltransferase [Blastocatellia bacterium]